MKQPILTKAKMYIFAVLFAGGVSASALPLTSVSAAANPCPNSGTLNQSTGRCEYTATSSSTLYCPNGGHTLSGSNCTYAATPTCNTGFQWYGQGYDCVGEAGYPEPCSNGDVQLANGPTGAGCYSTEPSNGYTCPGPGSLGANGTASNTCAYSASSGSSYSCSSGHTLSGSVCSYEATALDVISATVTDSLPNLAIAIPASQIVVVNGERGVTTVLSGGKLMGTGTVGNVTVNSGASIAPGNSPGVLDTGDLVLNGTYEFELGGTTPGDGSGYHDQINVTGTVDVSGATLLATLYGGFVPTVGQVFTIVNNDGSDAVSGTFNGLSQGASYQSQGVTYTVSYVGGSGNDITLTVTAVNPAELPTVPDTGLQLLLANPLATFATTAIATLGLVALARRVHA